MGWKCLFFFFLSLGKIILFFFFSFYLPLYVQRGKLGVHETLEGKRGEGIQHNDFV